MEATVTIKATPSELDLLRHALETHHEVTLASGNDPDFDPAERHAAKSEALKTEGLLGRLS